VDTCRHESGNIVVDINNVTDDSNGNFVGRVRLTATGSRPDHVASAHS
jgi:hypothetical protein